MCYYCGNQANETITRSLLCSHCRRELRICLNCKYYKKDAYWDCDKDIPEQVIEKERANFCDFFVYAPKIDKDKQEKNQKAKNEAKDNFLKLFNDE
jgi:formate dehydrogenase maturation protein FdhE